MIGDADLSATTRHGWPLVLGAVAAAAGIALLAVSGWFLTGAALAGAGGAAAVIGCNYLLPSAAIRGLAIARTLARYGERLSAHGAALYAMAGLRSRIFGRLAAADGRNCTDLASGEAHARLIDDIGALEAAIVRQSSGWAAAVAAGFGALMVAFAGIAAVVAFAVLASATTAGLALLGRRRMAATARALADARGAVQDRYVELAAARPEILAHGLGDHVCGAIEGPVAALNAARLAQTRVEAGIGAASVLANVVVMGAVIVLARGGAATVALAGMAAFAGMDALSGVVRAVTLKPATDASLARLTMPDGAEPTLAETPSALPITIAGLQLQPGDRLWLDGASGTGKTRMIEALAGIRPAGGLALGVGSTHPDALPIALLNAQFALAPQHPSLIAGTIADNLRLARPGVDEQAMWSALETACLSEAVRAMPLGLDTMLGEGGGTLSGGEQKRLSLARALLAERPWLLLDEPTEALDLTTEAELVAKLDRWLSATGTGLILASHRPGPQTLCALVSELASADHKAAL